MKIALLLTTLFPAGLCAALLGSSAARQEDDTPRPEEKRRVRAVQIAEPQIRALAIPPAAVAPGAAPMQAMTLRTTHGPMGEHGPVLAFARGPGSDRTRKAMQKLQNAESNDDKEEARADLKEALAEEFDEYLDHQKKELERMEEKLNKLRDQWSKRRDAKDDLVARRLQMLEDEAEGLGWPSRGLGGLRGAEGGVWSMEFPPTPGAPAAYEFSIPGAPLAPSIAAEVDVVVAEEAIEEPAAAEEPKEEDSEDAAPRRRRGGTR